MIKPSVLLYFGLFIFVCAPVAAVDVGRPAPSFKLKNSQGALKSLKDYQGKVLLINFWASWCGPCLGELKELNQLARDYRGKNFRVLAINVDEKSSDGRKLLKRLGLQSAAFETFWDNRSKIVSAYNIPAMPTSVIVDRHGTVRFIHSGFRPEDPAVWRREIDSLMR